MPVLMNFTLLFGVSAGSTPRAPCVRGGPADMGRRVEIWLADDQTDNGLALSPQFMSAC